MAVAVDDELAGRAIAFGDFLFDADDAPGGRQVERPGVGIQPTFQEREEGGLARAVLADDTHALAGIDDEICAIEKYLGTAPENYACTAYHDVNCSRVRSRIWSSLPSVASHTGSSSGKAAWK